MTHHTNEDGSPRVDVQNGLERGDTEGVRLLFMNAAMCAAEQAGGGYNGAVGYAELARRIGIAPQTISRMMNGKLFPRYELQLTLRYFIWQHRNAWPTVQRVR